MGTQSTYECLRCRKDCTPLANVAADSDQVRPLSFVCVGYNRRVDRTVPSDRFTLCWKNGAVDERGHWDRRDLLDTLSVIGQAVSIDENIRVNEGLTDEQMNEVDLMP